MIVASRDGMVFSRTRGFAPINELAITSAL